jgi:hypothetical protein
MHARAESGCGHVYAGLRLGIKEPFLKRQADAEFGVRVDDLSDIVYVGASGATASRDESISKVEAKAQLKYLVAVPPEHIDIPTLRRAIEVARTAGVAELILRTAQSCLREAVAAKAKDFQA